MVEHDFIKKALFLNFNNQINAATRTEIYEAFKAERDNLPVIFIATPFDKELSQFTRAKGFVNSSQMLLRLKAMANIARTVLDEQLQNPAESDINVIFRHDMQSFYHVVIKLERKVVNKENAIQENHVVPPAAAASKSAESNGVIEYVQLAAPKRKCGAKKRDRRVTKGNRFFVTKMNNSQESPAPENGSAKRKRFEDFHSSKKLKRNRTFSTAIESATPVPSQRLQKMPIVEFDPLQSYLKSLNAAYGHLAVFFCDRYAGDCIGIAFKPHFFNPGPFKPTSMASYLLGTMACKGKPALCPNAEAILEDFKALGEGFVESVQVITANWDYISPM